MKKMWIIAFILSGIFILSSSYSYSKKCKKCMEDLKNNNTRYYYMGLAHIDFSEPYRVIDGKVYALYRCEHGHKWWECLGDKE